MAYPWVDPTDEELMSYLKNKVQGLVSDRGSKVKIIEIDMYGEGEHRSGIPAGRDLFFPKEKDIGRFGWMDVEDPTKPGYALPDQSNFLYVFTKHDDSTPKVVAGCRTWHPSTEKEAVHDPAAAGTTSIPIGYKRSFTFKWLPHHQKSILRKWKWTMVEYNINPSAHGITAVGGYYVLWKLVRCNENYILLDNDSYHGSDSDSGSESNSHSHGARVRWGAPPLDDQRNEKDKIHDKLSLDFCYKDPDHQVKEQFAPCISES
ncbi:OLC1v1014353C1 [Oldenlandia corymbosa var. corymbosa]|uniref:OLC1v1014353C1 n=1 Tax=Oldenlandia corymbosa var. corymbosa TaxID=529605 RepID=A0AAV1E0K6_OLDCO|nr:OLC1v1014353C1 [Oldenlandia corymbosa var. corymbosa]